MYYSCVTKGHGRGGGGEQSSESIDSLYTPLPRTAVLDVSCVDGFALAAPAINRPGDNEVRGRLRGPGRSIIFICDCDADGDVYCHDADAVIFVGRACRVPKQTVQTKANANVGDWWVKKLSSTSLQQTFLCGREGKS